MLGKITGALIRKEADAYRAQGLHEEALALFKKSLNSGPRLPPDIQNAIEQQIRQLEAELASAAGDECEMLSDEQIAIIRKGWSGDASEDDLAGSAHALHAMGRYCDALEEFSILIRRGYSPHRIIGPMASCLAHLNRPLDLVEAVDRLAAALFQDSKNNFAFKLALAEEMVKGRFVEHSMELSRYLGRHAGIPGAYRIRLETLNKNLKTSFRKAHSSVPKPAAAGGAVAISPSVIQRIRAAVGKRASKRGQ